MVPLLRHLVALSRPERETSAAPCPGGRFWRARPSQRAPPILFLACILCCIFFLAWSLGRSAAQTLDSLSAFGGCASPLSLVVEVVVEVVMEVSGVVRQGAAAAAAVFAVPQQRRREESWSAVVARCSLLAAPWWWRCCLPVGGRGLHAAALLPPTVSPPRLDPAFAHRLPPTAHTQQTS